ncbi:BglG family transcription antiterminator LicT [Lactococcus fujiensis]|nr:PRD domain-containing protein [Lactococcus fujiensis]
MQIVKVFNNNALLVNSNHEEKFVMGKGIGFKKKAGDNVEESAVEKEFTFLRKSMRDSLLDLYEQLPPEEIDLVVGLIKEAEQTLHQNYFLSLYVSLADHIHFAVERAREGLKIKNPLVWEVRKFYPDEFNLSKKYIQRMNRSLELDLDEDEAAALALHFVNARQENGIFRNTYEITHIIDDILKIVRVHYHISFDENSLSFQRVITHLHYLGQRLISGDGTTKMMDPFLYEQVKNKYPEASQCVDKIVTYLLEQRGYKLDTDEIAYLTLHIQRLVTEIEN